MGKTSIEWTDASWNPVVGCSRVSSGCQHCYAERLAGTRLRESWVYKGLVTPRGQWNGEIRLLPERLSEPLRWRRPRKIFVCDMGDLFHESVPDDYLDRVFAVMVLAPQHTYQILTKRADRLAHYMRLPRCGAWPLPNVWCGVSVEDQRHADERIHLLLQTPAAVRFISAEPLLGPVDFRPHLYCPQCGYSKKDVAELMDHRLCKGPGPAIDQIVVGGESGPGARPCDVEWIRAIVRQCREANVACFVKQLGFSPVGIADGIAYRGNTTQMPDGFYRFLNDRKGSDPSEWPEDLRVREFPLRIA